MTDESSAEWKHKQQQRTAAQRVFDVQYSSIFLCAVDVDEPLAVLIVANRR